MKKINLKILLLSFAVTAVVLFGGWFGVKFFGQEKPITDWVADKEGIKIEELVIDQQSIYAEVMFDNKGDFGVTYIEFRQFLEQMEKGKEINIVITPEYSEYHPWWLHHSAAILEMIDSGEYTALQSTIDQWIRSGVVQEGQVLMNSRFIFMYVLPVDDEPFYLIFTITNKEGGDPHV